MMLLELSNEETPNAPAAGFALVGWFHTHPYYDGMPSAIKGKVYDDPKKPSPDDRVVSAGLGIPGLLEYQDPKGNLRTTVFGPVRNSSCY